MKNNKLFVVLVTICIFLLGTIMFYFIYEIVDDKDINVPQKEIIDSEEKEITEEKELNLDEEETEMLSVLANYAFMSKTNGKFKENLLKEALLNYVELYKEKSMLNEVVYQYSIEEDEIEEFITLAGYKNKNIDEIVNPSGSSILYEIEKQGDTYLYKVSGHGRSSHEVQEIKREIIGNKAIINYDCKCTEELGINKIGSLEITLNYNDDFYIENITYTEDGKEHYCY